MLEQDPSSHGHEADLNYVGSITVDPELLEARTSSSTSRSTSLTSIMEPSDDLRSRRRPRSGECCINGAAARLVHPATSFLSLPMPTTPKKKRAASGRLLSTLTNTTHKRIDPPVEHFASSTLEASSTRHSPFAAEGGVKCTNLDTPTQGDEARGEKVAMLTATTIHAKLIDSVTFHHPRRRLTGYDFLAMITVP